MAKKKKSPYRFEWVYDPMNNLTTMYMWKSMAIINKCEVTGKVTSEQKDAMVEDYTKKQKD